MRDAGGALVEGLTPKPINHKQFRSIPHDAPSKVARGSGTSNEHEIRLSGVGGSGTYRSRTMPTTPEISEVYPTTSEHLFRLFKLFETHLPQLVPHIITKAVHVQGDGGVGTINIYTFGHALSKDRMDTTGSVTVTDTTEVYDEDTKTMVIDVQGDPRYSSFKLKFQLYPGPVPGTTKLTSFAEYTPVGDALGPEEYTCLLPEIFASLVALPEDKLEELEES